MNQLASVRVRERGALVLASVAGELDVSNSAGVAAELKDAVGNSARGLLLDLSEVEFMDSSGVHMLYELAERLAHRQQSFAAVIPPRGVPRRAVELSGAAPAGWLHDDANAAVSALGFELDLLG